MRYSAMNPPMPSMIASLIINKIPKYRTTLRGKLSLRFRKINARDHRKMARPPRFERGTTCLEGRCSIQLSYGRRRRTLVAGAQRRKRRLYHAFRQSLDTWLNEKRTPMSETVSRWQDDVRFLSYRWKHEGRLTCIWKMYKRSIFANPAHTSYLWVSGQKKFDFAVIFLYMYCHKTGQITLLM